MKKFIIPVSGMTCASCALRIEESLKDLPSLESVTVNFPLERVEIQADHINLKEIKEKIEV
ncbi:MAG: hypothetical protein CBR30_01425 [Dictyoglomus sp. NZ13-RE01]|nr:MAG: hypothetical protein CBR30_01425 [Dictyoglomus sp. NZ13-RE01]